jgi:hypothetical protein
MVTSCHGVQNIILVLTDCVRVACGRVSVMDFSHNEGKATHAHRDGALSIRSYMSWLGFHTEGNSAPTLRKSLFVSCGGWAGSVVWPFGRVPSVTHGD